MKYTKRSLEELNLVDNFLFNEMMCSRYGKWFCQLLIQRICNRKTGQIKIFPQDNIQGLDTNLHGIRMDIYISDEDGYVYDIEPDKYITSESLPKRCRFYRGMIDSRLLGSGTPYNKLPDMWLVFILPYDPFGENKMIYTVKNHIEKTSSSAFQDGAVTLLVNTRGKTGGNIRLKQLLRYLENSVKENVVNEELNQLHKCVTEIKKNKKVGARFMIMQEFKDRVRNAGIEEGRKAGIEAGIEEGRKEIIFNMLEEALPIEKISKYSGQPKEYIYQIRDEMKVMAREKSAYKTK